MVGEWCLGTASEKPAELGEDDRRRYYRAMSKAQLRAWAPAVAWCYWSFKLNAEEPKLEPWDIGRAIEARWLPEDLAAPGDSGR
jgi:glucan 1,3-beta-glucosidase